MSNYTPGPWKFHLGRGVNPRFHIQTSAGYQIASTPEVNRYETREDDARLIAAAPELLEALQACLERIKTDYPDERDGPGNSPRNPGLIREVKDMAEAIITKAQGEAT